MRGSSILVLWILLVILSMAGEAIKDVQVYARYSIDGHATIDDYLNVSFLLKDEDKNIAADGSYIIMVKTDRGAVYAKREGVLKSSDFITKTVRWPTDQEITTTTVRSPEISINGSEFVNIKMNETTDKYENLGHKTPYGSGTVFILFIDREGSRFIGESSIEFRDRITGDYDHQ